MIQIVVITIIAIACVLVISIQAGRENKRLQEKLEDQERLTDEAIKLYHSVKEHYANITANEKLIQVDYCTSESDINKYKSDAAMEKAIRSKLALLVSHDIENWVEPNILELGDGHKKYSYVFKVRKV